MIASRRWPHYTPAQCLGLVAVLICIRHVHSISQESKASVMRGPCAGTGRSAGCTPNSDITLGGLIPVHLFRDSGASTTSCQKFPVEAENLQWVEAMRHAVDMVNNNDSILPGVRLGYEIRDSCRQASFAVLECLQFIGMSNSNEQCTAAQRGSRVQPAVVGVVGAFASSVSLRATELLGLFNIPLVSYGSTSPRLSNKQDFPYFLRTIPSDQLAAQAIAKTIRNQEWDFIGLIHTSDVFGVDGAQMVRQALGIPDPCPDASSRQSLTKICLSQSWEIVEGTQPNSTLLLDIWREILLSNPVNMSTVIIMFTQELETSRFFESVLYSDMSIDAHERNITFIGVDAWGDIVTAVQSAPSIARGAISPIPVAPDYGPFRTHWAGLKPFSYPDNPWLASLWQEQFGCVPNVTNPSDPCSLRHTLATGYSMSSKVPYVYHSVFAFAHALDAIYNACNRDIPCLKANASSTLLSQLKKLSFTTVYNSQFQFQMDGDPAISPYAIKNMVVSDSATAEISFPVVGNYMSTATLVTGETNCTNGTREITSGVGSSGSVMRFCLAEEFNVNEVEVVWNSQLPERPVSVCSAACEPGFFREFSVLNGSTGCQTCCWVCSRCPPNHISEAMNSDECRNCSIETKNNMNHTKCLPVPVQEFSVSSVLPAILMCVAVLGLIGLTVATVKCLMRLNDSFFVFGRHPTFLCLFGLGLTYISVLLESAGPTNGVCLARLVLAATGTTAVVSTIFLYVLHRLTVAGDMLFASALVLPFNRFLGSLFLEVITATLLVLFCYDGQCAETKVKVSPEHVRANERCGFQQADIAVLIYLCLMNITLFALCIGAVIVIRRKNLAPVVYDPYSRLFALIMVASGLSTIVTISCLAVQTGDLGAETEDAVLHLSYWQLVTAYFVMVFAQLIRKLGNLSKTQEIDFTEALERQTSRGSRSISIEVTSWAKSVRNGIRVSVGKLENISINPPVDDEEADVKSVSSGSYRESLDMSVMPSYVCGTPKITNDLTQTTGSSEGKESESPDSRIPELESVCAHNEVLHVNGHEHLQGFPERTETAM